MLKLIHIKSYRNVFPKNECGEIYVDILNNSIRETYFKFVQDTENDKISFARVRGIELVGNKISIKLFFQDIPENRKTVIDLGYELTGGDIIFDISVPNNKVYNVNFWKTAILNHDGWIDYTGTNYPAYVREMFKILIEYFNKIRE